MGSNNLRNPALVLFASVSLIAARYAAAQNQAIDPRAGTTVDTRQPSSSTASLSPCPPRGMRAGTAWNMTY